MPAEKQRSYTLNNLAIDDARLDLPDGVDVVGDFSLISHDALFISLMYRSFSSRSLRSTISTRP